MACLAKKAGDRPQNIAQILQILNSLEQSNSPSLPTTLGSNSILSRPLDSGLPITVEQNYRQLLWLKINQFKKLFFLSF